MAAGSWLQDWWDDIVEAFHAVKIDSTNTAKQVAGNAVRSVVGVPLVTPYDQLPQAPTPEPPSDSSLDSLRDDDTRALFGQLEQDLIMALSLIGYEPRRGETMRSDERQQWLWGVGRQYQADGRTGIVTDIRYGKDDNHGRGVAVDYEYVRIPGVTHQPDALPSTLAQVADAHPEMRTAFPLSSGDRDYHHWERRKGTY